MKGRRVVKKERRTRVSRKAGSSCVHNEKGECEKGKREEKKTGDENERRRKKRREKL